jgi:hypothetical protein
MGETRMIKDKRTMRKSLAALAAVMAMAALPAVESASSR